MSSLIKMELLKLVKRPMTWVLIILLLGGTGFGTVVSLLNLGEVTPELRESILQRLTLPGIFPWTAEFIYIFGAIMLAILAASSIGSEYSWGTLRPMLATGVSRARFLGAKVVALAVVALAFVLLTLLQSAVLAVPIALANDRPAVPTLDAAWLLDLAAIIGRSYLTVLVPMAIAFLVSLVGRSQAAGIGAALGLLIGEQIVALLLLSLGLDWSRALVKLFPGRNSMLLIETYNAFGAVAPPSGAVSESRALLTLFAYGIICLAVSFVIFRRRDIRGAA